MRKFIAIGSRNLGSNPTGRRRCRHRRGVHPWNCGTMTHSYRAAAGSASLSSTVLGCGMKVAIKCSPPQTGLMLGNPAYSGQTSSRNCPAGSLVNYRGQLLGTNW